MTQGPSVAEPMLSTFVAGYRISGDHGPVSIPSRTMIDPRSIRSGMSRLTHAVQPWIERASRWPAEDIWCPPSPIGRRRAAHTCVDKGPGARERAESPRETMSDDRVARLPPTAVGNAIVRGAHPTTDSQRLVEAGFFLLADGSIEQCVWKKSRLRSLQRLMVLRSGHVIESRSS